MSDILIDIHIHLLRSYFIQLLLVILDALLFISCEFGKILFSRFGESISHSDFLHSFYHLILVNFGLEVEEDGQEQFFLRVDQLLVEAEALYLREVDIAILWEDIIGSESYNRFFFPIVEAVEYDSSFTGIND